MSVVSIYLLMYTAVVRRPSSIEQQIVEPVLRLGLGAAFEGVQTVVWGG